MKARKCRPYSCPHFVSTHLAIYKQIVINSIVYRIHIKYSQTSEMVAPHAVIKYFSRAKSNLELQQVCSADVTQLLWSRVQCPLEWVGTTDSCVLVIHTFILAFEFTVFHKSFSGPFLVVGRRRGTKMSTFITKAGGEDCVRVTKKSSWKMYFLLANKLYNV